jgi:hypothetical protein
VDAAFKNRGTGCSSCVSRRRQLPTLSSGQLEITHVFVPSDTET